jgi:hypothetical protein
MLRILRSLLLMVSLLLLVPVAAGADFGSMSLHESAWQQAPAESVSAARRPLLGHHCLVPGPQPGSRLDGQPFAYGYFGARARPAAVYHRNSTGDWYQWSIIRAD